MQPSILQQPRVAIVIHQLMGLILGIAAYALVRQLPNRDLATLFNLDLIGQALTSGQLNLLALMVTVFGIGLGANHLLTALGNTLNAPLVGKVVVALIGIIVIGGLAIGVLLNWLTGIGVPLVMNTGIGLLVGSGVGWWIANALPRQSLAAWSIGAIAALLTGIAPIVLL